MTAEVYRSNVDFDVVLDQQSLSFVPKTWKHPLDDSDYVSCWYFSHCIKLEHEDT